VVASLLRVDLSVHIRLVVLQRLNATLLKIRKRVQLGSLGKRGKNVASKKKGGMKGCTIKNGCKSRSGGLTAKGRGMINRRTGSKLKAPQPGGGPRKRSFCARNKGQIKKFNINCRKTPKKRACLARKKWKCSN
tara:strand:+ start:956 stop:1357 length:402 start_codon:yes stop_codon:yes gene_type:complete